MNKSQKLAVIIVGLIWSTMGLYILTKGFWNIIGKLSDLHISIIILTVTIGLLKGYFVLGKYANKSLRSEAFQNLEPDNYLLGWTSIINLRTGILIVSMILLSLIVNYISVMINLTYVMGLVRIAIGIALLIGSLFYWLTLRDNHFVNIKNLNNNSYAQK